MWLNVSLPYILGMDSFSVHQLMNLWFAFTDRAPLVLTVGVAVTVGAELVSRRLSGRAVPFDEMKLSAVAGFSFMAVKVVAGYALALPVHLFVYRFRLFELDLWNPLTWLGIFLMRDFVSYWAHRIEHGNRWLWASHSIHHSFETMSPSCATRIPWMENLYKIPFGLWMPLIGFDFRLVVGIDTLAALISILQHTDRFPAKPEGWLQRVFIVPSHHRVHHGTNEAYLDKNFGAVLCVWDKLFGTFQPEVEPARFGILGRPLNRRRDMVLGRYPDLLH